MLKLAIFALLGILFVSGIDAGGKHKDKHGVNTGYCWQPGSTKMLSNGMNCVCATKGLGILGGTWKCGHNNGYKHGHGQGYPAPGYGNVGYGNGGYGNGGYGNGGYGNGGYNPGYGY